RARGPLRRVLTAVQRPRDGCRPRPRAAPAPAGPTPTGSSPSTRGAGCGTPSPSTCFAAERSVSGFRHRPATATLDGGRGWPMGLYRDHVLPRLVNATCGIAAMEPHRRRVCAGLHGEVVEIGF